MSKILYNTRNKILGREELAIEVRRRQQAGERGVFTNGCFDLLHLGHVRYLQQARALGDFLILGLNDDASVRALKGAGRPLVPAAERAEILAALTCIDYITVFVEPTASPLVALLQPAIYVKGGDYASTGGNVVARKDEAIMPSEAMARTQKEEPHPGDVPDTDRLPEARIVQAYGGIVRLIPYLPRHSTTELIEAIKQLPVG